MDLRYNCRICCLQTPVMIPLSSRVDELSLWSMLLAISDTELYADDGGSNFLCQKCTEQVVESFQLRKKCKQQIKPEEGWDAKCCFCNVATTSCGDMVNHITASHFAKETFFCTECSKTFPILSLYLAHCLRMHRRKSCVCTQCGMRFLRQSSLQDHRKTPYDTTVKRQFCCQKFSADPTAWNDHIKTLGSRECSLLHNQEITKENPMPTPSKRCFCRFCNEEFNNIKEMILHVNTYHKDGFIHRYKKSQEVVDQEGNGKPRKCNPCCSNACDCKKPNPSPQLLRRDKPYQCLYCPRRFKIKRSCEIHTRTHTGELPYNCNQCKRGFRQKANLMMHIFRYHKSAPPLEPMPFTESPSTFNIEPRTYTIDTSQVFEHLNLDYPATTSSY